MRSGLSHQLYQVSLGGDRLATPDAQSGAHAADARKHQSPRGGFGNAASNIYRDIVDKRGAASVPPEGDSVEQFSTREICRQVIGLEGASAARNLCLRRVWRPKLRYLASLG